MRNVLKCLAAIALLALVSVGSANAQEWVLNGGASHFYMQTAKANEIIEIHQFTGLQGTVSRDGDAEVKIDLTSVSSGIDVRDVRMRYLLFETYKFPNAEVHTHLDLLRLQDLNHQTRVVYPLHFTLSLHGLSKEFETLVAVTKVSDRVVSVATIKPIVVSTDDFALTAGLHKLSEAVNGTPIVAAASFTFDLQFEGGERVAAVQQQQTQAAQRKQVEEERQITPEECATRFGVISTTGAIYFRTNSAELDRASDPLLDSVADIANRCPGVKIEVSGHTDSTGDRLSNMRLSAARAGSVADFLIRRGVRRERISATGFGDTRPVAPNETEAGRAQNRRIVFRVVP
jgi:outer membrane protein OmpA-like peptidoglycan-associated protein